VFYFKDGDIVGLGELLEPATGGHGYFLALILGPARSRSVSSVLPE
jgi:hypothetical protein